MHTHLLLAALAALAAPQQPAPVDELARLRAELERMRADREQDRARLAEIEARQATLLEELDAKSTGAKGSNRWYDRLTLGGYGEIHLNRVAGSGGDQIDNHRFVAYLGYRFSDSIQLHSETELEHSFVEDGNGELSLEQLHVDFAIDRAWNVRAGRFLTPLGIVNERHEPTTFHGVERPLFDTVVIPSTWSSDGAGVFGEFAPTVNYQLYIGSSLDGSGFTALNGIRGGRQKERPGISEMALSGRLDWHAVRDTEKTLSLGIAGFAGGLDNGNQGVNPGVDSDLWILAADVRASLGAFDFRGVYAYEDVQGAGNLPVGAASAIDGFYAEAAWRVLPREGDSEREVALFARYDEVDTQKDMPTGVAADPRGRRDEWTVGVSWFPVQNLVIKADYQMRDDDASGLPERVNLGLGWSF